MEVRMLWRGYGGDDGLNTVEVMRWRSEKWFFCGDFYYGWYADGMTGSLTAFGVERIVRRGWRKEGAVQRVDSYAGFCGIIGYVGFCGIVWRSFVDGVEEAFCVEVLL